MGTLWHCVFQIVCLSIAGACTLICCEYAGFSLCFLEMSTPYSLDLHWSVGVVVHCSIPQCSWHSQASLCLRRTVKRYISYKTSGDVEPKTYSYALLSSWVTLNSYSSYEDYCRLYLLEIQAKLFTMYGVSVTTATICKTLRATKPCNRQVIQHSAVQWSDKFRPKFMAEISVHDFSMLIWANETAWVWSA